jgi:tryptophanase
VTQASPRIVVAEDEAVIRMDLVETLREEGYEVVGQAADGQDAVEQILAYIAGQREQIRGLRIVWQAPVLRHFTARFEVV